EEGYQEDPAEELAVAGRGVLLARCVRAPGERPQQRAIRPAAEGEGDALQREVQCDQRRDGMQVEQRRQRAEQRRYDEAGAPAIQVGEDAGGHLGDELGDMEAHFEQPNGKGAVAVRSQEDHPYRLGEGGIGGGRIEAERDGPATPGGWWSR